MSNTPAQSATDPRSRRGGRWVIGLLIGLMAAMAAMLWRCTSISNRFNDAFADGFQPPEMAAVQFARRDMVGDLGGVPVTIPRHFANYVEYEGDPGWGEKRKGPVPLRTHASRLASFGFDVHYPDMAGLWSSEMEADRRAQTIYTTMWIGVGVTTGPIYPGAGSLDRMASHINSQEPGAQRYTALPENQHGLAVYIPAGVNPGINPLTNHPYEGARDRRDTKDIFLHRTSKGNVDAHISCSNVGHAAAPCRHYFSLEPHMKANVYVSYRRGLLPHWQQIQESVTKLLASFEAPSPEPATGGR